MKPPPWEGDASALVLLDWSWFLNRAMHGEHGIDSMLALVVGWLTGILAYEPAHLAIALDSPGETVRHKLVPPPDVAAALVSPVTGEAWRYKAGRPPKPPEFASIAKTATRIAELHAIPLLWADGFEADDVIASAVRQAREAGYRVWIATGDKDLHHLVEAVDDPRGQNLVVGTWNPFERDAWVWRGPAQVREAYGVDPVQIPDWLAIAGDDSDGVPGVGHGLGDKRAAAILGAYGTLAEALAAPVWSSTKVEEVEGEIKALEKSIKAAKKKKSGGATPTYIGPTIERREALMEAKRVEGWRLTLKAHEAVALFSRELTVLDVDAPVDLPFDELPVGGFEVEALRALYTKHGFTRKAAEVPSFPKRAPWRLPWMADGAPAPRRIDATDSAGQGERRGCATVGRGRGLAPVPAAPMDVEPRVADEDPAARAPMEAPNAEQAAGVVGPSTRAGTVGEPVAPGGGSGVSPLSSGAEGVPGSWAPGRRPVLTAPSPRAEPTAEDIDLQLVEGKVARTHTALGRKVLLDDLLGGKKYRLRPEDKDRFVVELLRKGVAA